MKMSFLPGQLYLVQEHEVFVVSARGQELLRTKSQKRAVSLFNKLRVEMKQEFPDRDVSNEEKQELLRKLIEDSLVGDHSVHKKKKSTAKSTRTFG